MWIPCPLKGDSTYIVGVMKLFSKNKSGFPALIRSATKTVTRLLIGICVLFFANIRVSTAQIILSDSLCFVRWLTKGNDGLGLLGTDLGIPARQNDTTFYFFGDTKTNTSSRKSYDNSIAFSTAQAGESCSVQFLSASDGKFLVPRVGNLTLTYYEVPTGAFAYNNLFVFFADDCDGNRTQRIMGRSVLAQWQGSSAGIFNFVYSDQNGTFSSTKFINVATAKIQKSDVPGIPDTGTGQGLLLWGSGPFRWSSPYLAYLPLERLSDRNAIRYFKAMDAQNRPVWSTLESDAKEVFDHSTLGEFSAAWLSPLEKWAILYTSGIWPNTSENPKGVVVRLADQPWGPWSEPMVLEKAKPLGSSWNGQLGAEAVLYGPYLIPDYTVGTASQCTVYAAISIWDPYHVALSRFVLSDTTTPVSVVQHISIGELQQPRQIASSLQFCSLEQFNFSPSRQICDVNGKRLTISNRSNRVLSNSNQVYIFLPLFLQKQPKASRRVVLVR